MANENTRFSVTPLSGGTDIFVEEGRVYFALAQVRGTLSLSTPQETVTVQGTIINVSTETSMIKGYLLFEDNRMEIGVIEGGKLVVAEAGAGAAIEAGNSLLVQKSKAALESTTVNGLRWWGNSRTPERMTMSQSSVCSMSWPSEVV